MTRLLPILLLAVFCASCKTEIQQVKIQRAPVPVALSDIPKRSVARAVQSPLSVVPPSTQYLAWDSDYTEWKVYVGTNRNKWTTNFLTFNKSVPYDPAKFYGVASMVGGTESNLAYWPSNRIVNIVVEVSDNPSGNFVGSFTWMTYTNKILGQKKFMRLNEQFVRWE